MGSRCKVLCVGLVCVDIINVCAQYPEEDSDQRCLDQHWRRGGNASNNATVLSLLGNSCEFLGTIAKSHEAGFLVEDFARYGICIDHCVYYDQCSCPLSAVILNSQNGSRTILHSNRNLPEIQLKDLQQLDLFADQYKWIHFEGRCKFGKTTEIKMMLEFIDQHNKSVSSKNRVVTSVELEKKTSDLDVLLNMADYVFVSKDYAAYCGYQNKTAAVEGLITKCRNGSAVICGWGDTGAAGRRWDGENAVCSVFSPQTVVDTLGAGDTFIAGTIHGLMNEKSLKAAIEFGCQLAGFKCGIIGFDGLKDFSSSEQQTI